MKQSNFQVNIGNVGVAVTLTGGMTTQNKLNRTLLNETAAQTQVEPNAKFIVEGVDHYKNLFSFSNNFNLKLKFQLIAQRKVEYENYRFKYPSLLAVVIESINVKVLDNQKVVGKFFYRFHVSEDLLISELAEIIKFKINSKIREDEDKLGPKDRILFFNNRLSMSDGQVIKELYEKSRENDGWLYIDFIVDSIVV